MTAIATDKEGFLCDPQTWTPAVAEQIAAHERLDLSDAHWEIIHVLRNFYQEYDSAPAMRILVKVVRHALGEEKGNSIYLMQLFPGSPAKLASKVAGLPKPTNCL